MIADLPPAKQKMVQRLHESDEALKHKRVLVVDDDVRNIFALSSVLERHGMGVITAGTGQEAIEKVAEDGDIDLVLMDIMMPGMDGYDTMRAIRAQPRFARAADHRADREGDEGRSREMPRGRRFGLPRQAGRHRSAAWSAAPVAAPVTGEATAAAPAVAVADPVDILLVDDQPARLLAYRAILAPLAENLIEASSGTEALKHLMEREFALILLDVNMPGMDGFETASLIHQHPRFEKTPIIFVTAVNVSDMDRMRGYKLGAVDYVTVPIIPEILRSKVIVLSELFRKRRELQLVNQQARSGQRRASGREGARAGRVQRIAAQGQRRARGAQRAAAGRDRRAARARKRA